MLPCILTFVLIGQALLQGSVLASDSKASLVDRANTIFELLAFDRQHRHSKKSICEQTDWRKQSLKLVKEIPFAGLFQDLRGESKFEASGLVHVNDTYYVVFDSHRSLGVVNDKLEMMSETNLLAGEIGEESQFEGITYRPDTNTFLVIQESHMHADDTLKPLVEELMLFPTNTAYRSIRACDIDLELSHANKGVESIQYYDAGEQGQFLFALCEGNFCVGGKRGKKAGNGRLIISQLETDANDNTNCKWVPVKTVHVPSTAAFTDYSGMAFNGKRFGIVSQENAALWVGEFDFGPMEFTSLGKVYHFPRDNNCDMMYCTVEGLSWIDHHRIAVTLDRAKADQPFVCTSKDQSIAVFMLPHGS